LRSLPSAHGLIQSDDTLALTSLSFSALDIASNFVVLGLWRW
jgi:hypothetical protein